MNKLELVNDEALERQLKRHLDRRELPDAFLYTGDIGAHNWLTLEASDRFPIASALTDLMEEHAASIAERVGARRSVVSIGAGDAQKEKILLARLAAYARPVCHMIDISSRMVDEAIENLGGLGLELRGAVAFCEDIDTLAPYWDRPLLLCLLGNNFCNYDPSALLSLIHRNLGGADVFLFDCNLLPDRLEDIDRWVHEMEAVYNSPENVQFNIAPLVTRGVDPDACEFSLKLITVNSPAGPIYRTRKQIHLTRPAIVHCGNQLVHIAAGETIEMGFTYKYRLDQLRQCLIDNGFETLETWPDRSGDNVIVLTRTKIEETES
jgi:uncharacterized SAM-dependent methyltransferase